MRTRGPEARPLGGGILRPVYWRGLPQDVTPEAGMGLPEEAPAKSHGHESTLHHAVEAFAVAIADEAYRRLVEFGQQGLSNISWASATLDSTRNEGAHRFMIAAAEKSIPGFRSFPPQAIAKSFWALGRLNNCRGTLAFFGAAVVGEGMERPDPFSWQNCSCKHTISMEIDTHNRLVKHCLRAKQALYWS